MSSNIVSNWIWPSECSNDVNQYVQFRHEFELHDSIEKAEFIVSCDSNYALWANGKFIDCGQYNDFPSYKIYDVLEIHNLKPGRNVLAFIAYHQGESSFQYAVGKPGLIYQLNAGDFILASGKDALCRVDPNYKSGRVDKITDQLGFSFEYDARGTDDWRSLDYKPGSDWKTLTDAEVITAQDRPLASERPIKKLAFRDRIKPHITAQGLFVRKPDSDALTLAGLMQTDYLSTREFSGIIDMLEHGEYRLKYDSVGKADGIYLVLDLGREEAGLLDLDIEAASGTEIDISWGEQFDDLRVRAYVGGRNFACKYTCSEGRQRLVHYFKRLGGRYLQLHIHMSSDVIIHYAGVVPWEYPVEHKGSFSCSDSLHTKIYETCARTLHLCMHEHYEDTPWREQGLYAMDMRNQALAGYYCFGEYEFPAASITLLAESLMENGLLKLCAPTDYVRTIPVFSLAWVLAVSDHYTHSGDIDSLRGWFPTVKAILDKRAETVNDGLLPVPCGENYWQFYDWAFQLDGLMALGGYRYDAPLNFFYILALDASAELADALGDDKTKAVYKSLASDLKINSHKLFWDETDGSYQTYLGEAAPLHHCELAQALAILAGICPEDIAAKLRKRLADPDNGWVKTSLSYSFYKFQALLTDPEGYAKIVFDEIKRDWGHMLFSGSTSFWETIQGSSDFGNAGSMCHGWSGIPAYFYHAYALGVKPATPGFKQYERKPAKVFERAEGTVPTPQGSIDCR